MGTAHYLFWPAPEHLVAAGFPTIAHVPCIFDSEWRYHEVASRYLRARARSLNNLGGHRRHQNRPRYPTKKSLRSYGESLVNFLEWCASSSRDWVTLDYTDDLLHGYQADMSTGRWSARRVSLQARTINKRIDEACKFLQWAAGQGLREPFDVPMREVATPAKSSTSTRRGEWVSEVRVGSVRPDPTTLRIPRDEEVTAWHRSVLVESGPTKALMCELVLETAVRREEAVQWRIDTLPINPDDWNITGDKVMVKIRHGTKGPKRKDESGAEIGPARDISLPLTLAYALHQYRETVRPKLLAAYVKSASSLEEKRARMKNATQRLFLSDHNGEPVSAQRFYEAWVGASRLPYPGWSPHLGRHWWACKTLLTVCRLRLGVAPGGQVFGETEGVLISSANDAIMLVLGPQMGHISEQTTKMYLVWIQRIFMLATLHDDYEQALESVAKTFGS